MTGIKQDDGMQRIGKWKLDFFLLKFWVDVLRNRKNSQLKSNCIWDDLWRLLRLILRIQKFGKKMFEFIEKWIIFFSVISIYSNEIQIFMCNVQIIASYVLKRRRSSYQNAFAYACFQLFWFMSCRIVLTADPFQ